jgi:hypothetical protein
MRFWTLGFFHQSTHPRALIYGLKPFCILLWICQKFKSFNETAEVDLVVYMRLRKWLLRFQWDWHETAESLEKLQRIIFPQEGSFQYKTMSKKVWIPWSQQDSGSGFSGLIEIAEADSAVSMTPQNPILWSQWDSGILYDTAEAFTKMTIDSQFL